MGDLIYVLFNKIFLENCHYFDIICIDIASPAGSF